ncbi:MAG TPA: neutral/alkaline non-lysosomal ceramidase N-terminal domain-containing protein [Kribbella sp.]
MSPVQGGFSDAVSSITAGAAVVDVTPAVGAAMSGFVARSSPSTGVHDPITVRAVCVEDTALVTVDVVGLHEDFCAAVARGTSLPPQNVRVHATHTHGGPASVPGRLGNEADPVWLESLEAACINAVEEALRNRRPAQLLSGYGIEVGVAQNRRRPDGPVDRSVPVAQLVDSDGRPIAVLASYACHPVVLGADNTLLTADYPGVVRRAVEERFPGAVAMFLTGCAGDANTGHAASASVSLRANDSRTFAAAEAAGAAIAAAVAAAPLKPCDGPIAAAVGQAELTIDADPQVAGASRWGEIAADPDSDPATAALMRCWANWAARTAASAPTTWTARVGVLAWGGIRIITLPGEPFARTSLDIRAALDRSTGSGMAHRGNGATFVVGYTDGCPGYLPPACEHPHGGYEVLEAHRYYNLPGPFAPDSATRLTQTALTLAAQVATPKPGQSKATNAS